MKQKSSKQLRISKSLKAYELINSGVEASFVSFIVDLRVFAFILAKRMFWTVDGAGRTVGAAGTRTAAV